MNIKILAILALMTTFLFGAVDINSASKTELMTLNGVGAKKANAIIEYRNKSCFKKVAAITNVKGIGTKFLEKNRTNLKAGKCKK